MVSLTTRVASLAIKLTTKRDVNASYLNDVQMVPKQIKLPEKECELHMEKLTQLRVNHGVKRWSNARR